MDVIATKLCGLPNGCTIRVNMVKKIYSNPYQNLVELEKIGIIKKIREGSKGRSKSSEWKVLKAPSIVLAMIANSEDVIHLEAIRQELTSYDFSPAFAKKYVSSLINEGIVIDMGNQNYKLTKKERKRRI